MKEGTRRPIVRVLFLAPAVLVPVVMAPVDMVCVMLSVSFAPEIRC